LTARKETYVCHGCDNKEGDDLDYCILTYMTDGASVEPPKTCPFYAKSDFVKWEVTEESP
jgi:hypothetical protein